MVAKHPTGVGADSSRPYPYINKYTYPHYRIYVSTLSHIHIHIIKHVHSFHRIRIFISPHTHFPPPLRGRLRIHGHDKSDPYSCERIAIMLLTVCNNAANKLQYTHVHPRNTILSHRKYHTFALQTPYFRTAKTILSHHKNHTFTPQKPIGDKLGGSQKRFVKIIIVAETNISHTQNKTLSSLLEYHFLNHYNRLYRVRITI